MKPSVPAFIRLMRPEQWIKNSFVCAGVLFSAQLHNLTILKSMAFAVLAFCLMGSTVYVLNDSLDRESDKKHPTKRHRPIASGQVKPGQAISVAIICCTFSVVAAWIADPRVLIIVLLYLAVNIAYSIRLKHEAVLDVFCIASGFMLRIIAGTWGIRIPPSGWLILTGMFLTLFLGFAKRRAEWKESAGMHARRQVLSVYSEPLLDSLLSITLTGTALSYGLYTLDAQTIALHHTDKLIYTTPFVLFGLFRYLLILHSRNKGEDPSTDVFADGQILTCGCAYVAVSIWLLNR